MAHRQHPFSRAVNRTSIGQRWSNNNVTEREGAMQALMSALDEVMAEAGVRLTTEARKQRRTASAKPRRSSCRAKRGQDHWQTFNCIVPYCVLTPE